MKKFEVGKTYSMHSICDHNCIWYCEIISRTEKFLTIKVSGYIDPIRVKVRVKEYGWQESCYPLGIYSMAPSLRTENEVEFLHATRMHLGEAVRRGMEK